MTPLIAAVNWLDISINLLLVIHVIICLLLALVVLMQRPKQEGLGAAFGSGLTDQAFGARTTDVLQKGTIYLGTLFFVVTVVLAILIGKRQNTIPTVTATEADAVEESAIPAAAVPAADAPVVMPGTEEAADEPEEEAAPEKEEAETPAAENDGPYSGTAGAILGKVDAPEVAKEEAAETVETPEQAPEQSEPANQ